MARRIYKYSVPLDGQVHEIRLNLEAEVLHFEMQYGTPCFWALHDDDAPWVLRRFLIVGTGHALPGWAVHRGSLWAPPFVWHLVELP